jgi:uncharacterized protein
MISQATLEEVKSRLVKVYSPRAIYLFGSYAWGSPTDESDLDLLVVVDEADAKDFWRSSLGDEALVGLKIPRDILVYSKKEFDQLTNDTTSLCYKIKRDGKVLYASA